MGQLSFTQNNPWGKTNSGLDPQRTDHWYVDMSSAVNGFNADASDSGMDALSAVHDYHCRSVKIPGLKVKGEEYRKDNRPYWQPGFDTAVEPITMEFIFESLPGSPGVKSSSVYRLCEVWRAFVRAGRQPMGTEKVVPINADFSFLNFRYDIPVQMMSSNPASNYTETGNAAGANNNFVNGAKFILEKAWLYEYKVKELSYQTSDFFLITTNFYCDNVLDANGPSANTTLANSAPVTPTQAKVVKTTASPATGLPMIKPQKKQIVMQPSYSTQPHSAFEGGGGDSGGGELASIGKLTP